MRLGLTAFMAGVVFSWAAARAQPVAPPASPLPEKQSTSRTGPDVPDKAGLPSELLLLDGHDIPLGGALRQPSLWRAYKSRFVTESGRVIDTGNGAVSHSEGQGYGMLLAVAANDRIAFDRIWGWTRANLMVRDDQLLAWLWQPNARPAVADMNNATDGDILVAWALAEAAELWRDDSYKAAARRIAVEVGRKLIVFDDPEGPLLLPGVAGFAKADRPDGPVLNLSYWVFPALERLPLVAPEIDWRALGRSGLRLVEKARFGPAALPVDWISLRNGTATPAAGFPRTFSFNAIRIPLYMAFAGMGEQADFQPFVTLWSKDPRLASTDVDSGAASQPFGESGYDSISQLVMCVTKQTPLPHDFYEANLNQNYYPATLQLLAITAAQMRYGSCSHT